MTTHRTAILCLLLACSLAHAQRAFDASSSPSPEPLDGQNVWTQFAGNAKRHTLPTLTHSPSLTTVAWENPEFIPIPQSGLVVDAAHVYAIARDASNAAMAVALDRETGSTVWSAPVAPPILDSWSSPAIDLEHSTLIVASGATMVALDTATGDQVWSQTLPTTIVNTSPVVTDDLGDRDRVLITTYSFGFGEPARPGASIHRPLRRSDQPHQPGEIVWSKILSARQLGQHPRLPIRTRLPRHRLRRRRYNAAPSAADITAKHIAHLTALVVHQHDQHRLLRRRHHRTRPHLRQLLQLHRLADQRQHHQLNKNTGDLVWSVPTNRTDATPIVLPTGDIVVSSGVATSASTSCPLLRLAPQHPVHRRSRLNRFPAVSSALATHDDLNNNGIWDFRQALPPSAAGPTSPSRSPSAAHRTCSWARSPNPCRASTSTTTPTCASDRPHRFPH
ncbi:MAG: PQQ-binding-like beta-propeller repeat protein [Phycisphaerales bacterium]